jgi:mannose-6-phosphate isomerase-like protein (cupin superfamily)
VLSIADLAERSLSGRDAVKTVPVACSGLDNTQMLVIRETLKVEAKNDVDQMLYVVAGEATLSLDGRDQPISSGWYAMVPRGMEHTLTRRGRNPAIVLVTTGGERCQAE